MTYNLPIYTVKITHILRNLENKIKIMLVIIETKIWLDIVKTNVQIVILVNE